MEIENAANNKLTAKAQINESKYLAQNRIQGRT